MFWLDERFHMLAKEKLPGAVHLFWRPQSIKVKQGDPERLICSAAPCSIPDRVFRSSHSISHSSTTMKFFHICLLK
jgi:hypothetical protein